jgi:siroheme synthase (precorrin-2 oxidase/ferrochelatase)
VGVGLGTVGAVRLMKMWEKQENIIIVALVLESRVESLSDVFDWTRD